MKFVVDSKIPFIKGVLEKKGIEVIYLDPVNIIKESIKNVEGLIIRTRTKCDAKLLEGTKVKFIATATIGFDHIDTNYCREKDIFWTNAPGCNSSSVAQYICSAILNWALSEEKDLNKLKIGIIGVGNVGSKVAKVSEILGMQTLLNDPPREKKEGKKNFVPLTKILQEADIITIHVPLEYEGIYKTFHLADDKFFCEIRKKPLFINSSRGEVVNTMALKKAISQNLISSAIIDVWENEPDIDLELLKLAKFATPHIAGYSTDGKANGTAMVIRAASKFFKLGLDEWYPNNLPIPDNNHLKLSSFGLQAIADAVNFSYDIRNDDRSLRKSPDSFENLRGKYPLRREFHAFEVDVAGQSQKIIKQLRELGFKIKI